MATSQTSNHTSEGSVRRRITAGLLALGLLAAIIAVPYQFGSKAAKAQDDKKDAEAIEINSTQDPRLPNYDIRMDTGDAVLDFFATARGRLGKNMVDVANLRDSFVRGEQAIKARIPNVKVEYNPDIQTPEVITPDVWQQRIGFLTPAKTGKRSELLRGFLKESNDLIGVTDAQLDALKVTANYTNPDGRLSYAHLEQFINGVPVFRGEVKAGFTRDGRIFRVINNLATGLDYATLSTNFGDPADAVKTAADLIYHELPANERVANPRESTDLKVVFGEGDWATTAEKMYFPTEPGVAVPAWRVLIWQPVTAYYVIVDAASGRMLWRKNLGNDQAQPATFQVYNNPNAYMKSADSPAPLSPGPSSPNGVQGAIIGRTNIALIGNEGALNFNNNGWITDNTNITDGNATEAGIDRAGTNGVDATQAGDTACPGAGCRVFTSTWNPAPGSPAPGDDPLTAQAQRGAVIQMFYVMNRYHDALYQVGFTEAARNFQANNFGRGGTGNDRVSSEGQDNTLNVSAGCGGTSLPPCFNNANFSTPADGARGRMQMYLWNGPTPDYDGTADADIIIHEVTHGTSNRLIGNASGLNTNMSQGMGEGWGDFYGYTLLAEPTDPIDAVYTTGGYATYLGTAGYTSNYYYGIRRFPRAPITLLGPNGKPHNPFTFRFVNAAGCSALVGTTTSNPPPSSAYPRGPFGANACDAVHNLGEVWSSMLWEVRNRMVTRLGFTAGTTRVLQVVTDGMKMTPNSPTFLQARDAIISAANALSLAPEATLDVSDVREGFRVRGMGLSASIQNQSSGSTAVTEAYDGPTATIAGKVTYKNTLTAGYAVPNTLISAAGSSNVSTTSDVNGNYSLSGFGAGAYTVTPSKTPMDDLSSNGITVDDAALIARHVVGLETLTDEQKEAARVLGDPTITTLDAAYIARWIVGFNDASNQTGTWKFTPGNRAYAQMIGTPTAQDFAALLMGDVNRDWLTGPSARPSLLADPTWKTAIVSVPNVSAVQGSVLTIPVRIDNLAGRGISSYQFAVEYDPAVLSPIDAETAGTMSSTLSAVSNERLPGLFKVAAFGAYPAMGDGVWINLRFNVVGTAGTTSPVALQGFRFNDGSSGVVVQSGRVKVVS